MVHFQIPAVILKFRVIDYATGWTIRSPNSGTSRRVFFPPGQNICDSYDMGNIPFVTILLTTNLAGINIRGDDEYREHQT